MMTLSNTETINKKTETHLKSMMNLAETITASAIKDVQEFPFVRVPNFELLGSHTRSIVGNGVEIWAPLILETQREEWSKFSSTEIGWYNESLTILHDEASFPTDQYVNGSFRDEIWEGSDLSDTSYVTAAAPGPFAPLWQISPPTLSVSSINYNLLHSDYIRDILPGFIQASDCVMSAAKTDSEGLSKEIVSSQDLTHEFHADVPHPHTTQLTPVFDHLGNKSTVVGFVLSTIDWDTFLTGVFSTGTNGVDVVIRNNCNQSITFSVKNGEVCYMYRSSHFLEYIFLISRFALL